MIGYVTWQEQADRRFGKRLRAEELVILNMRFLCIRIPRGRRTPELLAESRAAAAARALSRRGVTRAVFPADFSRLECFARRGILPPETGPLLRKVAAPWAQAEMAERGLSPHSTVIAVVGEHLSGELVRAVTELSLRNRYVVLDVPYGGEELRRSLRREYGISLLVCERAEQREEAEVLVSFSPARTAEAKNPLVLDVSGERPGGRLPRLEVPEELELELPKDCDRLALFASLVETGALHPAQLEIAAGKSST